MDMRHTSSLCSALFHSNIGKSVTHRIECLDYISEREKQVMSDTGQKTVSYTHFKVEGGIQTYMINQTQFVGYKYPKSV